MSRVSHAESVDSAGYAIPGEAPSSRASHLSEDSSGYASGQWAYTHTQKSVLVLFSKERWGARRAVINTATVWIHWLVRAIEHNGAVSAALKEKAAFSFSHLSTFFPFLCCCHWTRWNNPGTPYRQSLTQMAHGTRQGAFYYVCPFFRFPPFL